MNELYPVFLKMHQLETLLVGGGNVGLEKLTFLLKSSPNAKVTVVSKAFLEEIVEIATNNANILLVKGAYSEEYLNEKHLVIAATDDKEVNKQVYRDAKKRYLLVNVADTPEFCDFYLGGIVTKGNIKIGISTNGKSPTTAKRLRQLFEEIIPDDINEMVENINKYRATLKGDFEEKVDALNKLTVGLMKKNNKDE
ncbi:precorrin-2 dehydrogenase/sirohydrochlorin ferrochelatase family protein [Cyclobacterium marinum]|uniref:precorrin-2 dehydrogenase n=1 Tax=Cyclobacterium marinum (strain ATCC 25205 / DSM 745 / LMG 13164 / NCIMB 1802) TaxID=880070 RepID=G0IVQ4_CYCMS|nr:bifunctional precorrin-2 dehydrogenase/sirohydrochlorin ferrochelatase [Cyclobacterium marinum]AEL24821.1 siroheme synthase [Cyclobacterium marinum DSM 745]MBI0401707.1 bifunctional precorrin-2 dehydrogenase/sirohydrochlorin ferrochelatase [Cyclobacterium marinum]|tara:strand:+ start:9433 stop:10020 length:588 start_codon:yes stop_codon:yes gene_type:complete